MRLDYWNRDNLIEGGKNIFVFRNTCHWSPEIQERIFNEVYSKIQHGLFDIVFVEGVVGEYLSLRITEDALMEYSYKRRGACPSVRDLLANRCISEMDSGNLKLYGIEDEFVLKKYVDVVREIVPLSYRVDGGDADLDEIGRFEFLKQEMDVSSKLRILTCSDNIVKQMEQNKQNVAGLIFGDGHCDEITNNLFNRGIGYASFSPGKVPVDLLENLRYARHF